MAAIKKTGKGRYRATFQDKFRGIARVRHTFGSAKEAEDWIAALKTEATDRLLGRGRRRLFGEALARYLRDESPRKISQRNDIGDARALRWPIWDPDARRWLYLEDTPLEEVPGVLARWSTDVRLVQRRRYIGNKLYHFRPGADGRPGWYYQPEPAHGGRPVPREIVTDARAIAELEKGDDGRGPYSSGTIRTRQLLVRRILKVAWKHWSVKGDVWLSHNVADKVELDVKPPPLDQWLTSEQLLDLVIAAPPGFDAAILAGGWIGWRRANLLGLEWSRVAFPVYAEHSDGSKEEIQPGYIWVPRRAVKGKKRAITYPMVPHIEQLFRLLWESRSGPYVFHRGDGRPFGEFRKLWASVKRRAGISPEFHWHGLRHTWTSHMLQAGAHSKQVAELGGWTSAQMVEQVYGHLAMEHLRETAVKGRRTV